MIKKLRLKDSGIDNQNQSVEVCNKLNELIDVVNNLPRGVNVKAGKQYWIVEDESAPQQAEKCKEHTFGTMFCMFCGEKAIISQPPKPTPAAEEHSLCAKCEGLNVGGHASFCSMR